MSAGGRGGGEHGGSGTHGAGGGNGAGAKGSGGNGGGAFQGGLNGGMGIPQWAANRRYPTGTFGQPQQPMGLGGMPGSPVQPQQPIYHPQAPINPDFQYLPIPGPSPYGVNIMGQNPTQQQIPPVGGQQPIAPQQQLGKSLLPGGNPNMAQGNPWMGQWQRAGGLQPYGRSM